MPPSQHRTSTYVGPHVECPQLESIAQQASSPAASTGAVEGIVTELSGDPFTAVTVIATSPAIASQARTAITDDKGVYMIDDLPPGDYRITFYYADITVERDCIHVGIGASTPVSQKLRDPTTPTKPDPFWGLPPGPLRRLIPTGPHLTPV